MSSELVNMHSSDNEAPPRPTMGDALSSDGLSSDNTSGGGDGPARPTFASQASSGGTEAKEFAPLVQINTAMSANEEHEPSISIKPGERPSVALSWENVDYSVSIKGKKRGDKPTNKHILKGVSGFAKPGEVTVIMGSSGAGKTTLLNILSNRLPPAESWSGKVMLNGVDVSSDPSLLRAYGGYVMQDDVFYETMTTRELLRFSATLKLPRSLTPEDIEKRVDDVIEELGLKNCQNTKVGGGFIKERGLSGGEKKRTAIGAEIITNPSILWLDEPTSGLDSLTALHLMQTLRKLARKGNRTVICTIHQPSSDMYNYFDSLVLMVQGKIIYQGPASNAVDYFGKQGYACPPYSNPSDFFMAKVMKYQSDDKEDNDRFEKLVEAYDSTFGKTFAQEAEKVNVGQKTTLDESVLIASRITKFKEFQMLLHRSFVNATRQPLLTKVRFLQTIVLSLIVSVVYSDIGKGQSSVPNRLGALFMVAQTNFMGALGSTVLSFGPEKAIFVREVQGRMYRTQSYFLGKLIAELPFNLIWPTVYAVVCYFIIGLQATVEKFFMFLLAITLLGLTGLGIGLDVGCVAPNAGAAASFMPVVIMPTMLFSGFFVATDNIPVYFRWIQYISPLYYSLSSLLIGEFHGLKLDACTTAETKSGRCFYPDGDAALTSYLNLNVDDWNRDIIIMAAMFVFYLGVAFIILTRQSR